MHSLSVCTGRSRGYFRRRSVSTYYLTCVHNVHTFASVLHTHSHHACTHNTRLACTIMYVLCIIMTYSLLLLLCCRFFTSRPQMEEFLATLLHFQHFRQFINNKIDQLKNRSVNRDLFDIEAMFYDEGIYMYICIYQICTHYNNHTHISKQRLCAYKLKHTHTHNHMHYVVCVCGIVVFNMTFTLII